MKKSFLAVAVAMACITSVKAQMAKGNLFIGSTVGTTTYNSGSYNFNYSDGNIKSQDAKDYSLNLSPSMGVFLTDHLIFGGNLNLVYSHNKNNITNTTDGALVNNTTVSSTTFTVGPFFRYYFFNSPESKTVFFLQGDAAAGTGGGSTDQAIANTNGSSSNSTANNNNMFVFRGGGGIGITHFVAKNIGLDFGVGYQYNYQKYTTTFTDATTTAGGQATTTPGTYKATVPQNGFTANVGFHFFIK